MNCGSRMGCFLWLLLLVMSIHPVVGWSQDAAHSCPGAGGAVRIDEPSRDIDFAYARGHLFKMDNLGLTIWSLENPDQPRMVSAVAAERGAGYGDGSFLMGDRLEIDDRGYGYVVENGGGVICFDLRFPAHPRKLWTSADLPNPFLSFAIAANDSILASQSLEGFSVDLIDVSDPYHPVLLEPLPNIFIMSDLEMSGDVLFVLATESLGGLHVYDVGEADSPVLLGVFSDYFSDPDNIWGGVWAGVSKALIHSHMSKLAVIDFLDPENIVLHDLSDSISMYWIEEAVWDGSDALAVGQEISDGRRGFFRFGLENPTNPVVTFESEVPRAGWGSLANTEDRLYRADYSSTIAAYALGSGLPQTLSGVPAGRAEQMAVDGAFGYVADGNAGLQILDVSDPLHPVPLARLPLPGYAVKIVVEGGYAYVAVGEAGLVIIGIRNPREPKIVSILDLQSVTYDLDCSGSTVVVTTGDGFFSSSHEVVLVDVTDPSCPAVVSSVPIDNEPPMVRSASGVTIDGQVAWVVAARTLMSIDISQPSVPQVLGELDLVPSNSHLGLTDVATLEGLAVVTIWVGFPRVVDISDPSEPVLLSTLTTGEYSKSVVASGTTAVIGDPETTVIDFSDPSEPIARSVVRIRDGFASAISNGVLYSTAAPFIDIFTLECRSPEASFRYHSSGRNYWFTNTSQWYFADVLWDFGDGSEASTELNPSHRFPTTGEFTVTLEISGDQGNDSSSRIITVTDVYSRRTPDRENRRKSEISAFQPVRPF